MLSDFIATLQHTHAHTRTHIHTHAQAHAYTHIHTHWMHAVGHLAGRLARVMASEFVVVTPEGMVVRATCGYSLAYVTLTLVGVGYT